MVNESLGFVAVPLTVTALILVDIMLTLARKRASRRKIMQMAVVWMLPVSAVLLLPELRIPSSLSGYPQPIRRMQANSLPGVPLDCHLQNTRSPVQALPKINT